MTPDTKAIRARAEAATAGPWRYDPTKCYTPGVNGARDVRTSQEAVFSDTPTGAPTIALTGAVNDAQSMADATFIAHARTDIPALCDEVDELRATLANERGEGEPPEEGWEWVRGQWETMDGAFGGWECIVKRSGDQWHFEWVDYSPDADEDAEWPDGYAPTARAAMRAATAALRVKP